MRRFKDPDPVPLTVRVPIQLLLPLSVTVSDASAGNRLKTVCGAGLADWAGEPHWNCQSYEEMPPPRSVLEDIKVVPVPVVVGIGVQPKSTSG